jgi:hypothetical protein
VRLRKCPPQNPTGSIHPQWPVSFLAAYGTVRYNDRRLLVEPEVGSLIIITATHINTLIQFRALDYGMESCSLALHLPEYGSEAMMEITRVGSSTIDVWSLALDDKIDSQGLSYRSFPRRIGALLTHHIGATVTRPPSVSIERSNGQISSEV